VSQLILALIVRRQQFRKLHIVCVLKITQFYSFCCTLKIILLCTVYTVHIKRRSGASGFTDLLLDVSRQ